MDENAIQHIFPPEDEQKRVLKFKISETKKFKNRSHKVDVFECLQSLRKYAAI